MVSISLSLIAVFIPILLMGGIVGRLFREFAVTLSVAILVSMVISLTTTPMLCAVFLQAPGGQAEGPKRRSFFDRVIAGYGLRALRWALRHSGLVLLILFATIGAECLPDRHHAQGVLPAAGYRAADWAGSRPTRASRSRRWKRS